MSISIDNIVHRYEITAQAGAVITVYKNGNPTEVSFTVKAGNQAKVQFVYQELPI